MASYLNWNRCFVRRTDNHSERILLTRQKHWPFMGKMSNSTFSRVVHPWSEAARSSYSRWQIPSSPEQRKFSTSCPRRWVLYCLPTTYQEWPSKGCTCSQCRIPFESGMSRFSTRRYPEFSWQLRRWPFVKDIYLVRVQALQNPFPKCIRQHSIAHLPFKVRNYPCSRAIASWREIHSCLHLVSHPSCAHELQCLEIQVTSHTSSDLASSLAEWHCFHQSSR